MRVRFCLVSFTLVILLGSTARAIDENVEFFVVPQSATVPRSGRIVFDIYARNLSDKAVIVAAPSQTRASYRLIDSQGHRFDRFFGSTGGSPHVDPRLALRPVRFSAHVSKCRSLLKREIWLKFCLRLESDPKQRRPVLSYSELDRLSGDLIRAGLSPIRKSSPLAITISIATATMIRLITGIRLVWSLQGRAKRERCMI